MVGSGVRARDSARVWVGARVVVGVGAGVTNAKLVCQWRRQWVRVR